MSQRRRRSALREKRGGRRPAGYRVPGKVEFINPWPFMSDLEAMVKMALDKMSVPYSWRLFDGDAPTLKALIPDYAPEFTLREYKYVIVVVGGFFGTLPGVLDRTALAQAALEADGWKVAILLENDVRRDPYDAITHALPALRAPTIKGPERPNALGATLLGAQLARRAQQLRALAFHKSLFRLEQRDGTNRRRRVYLTRVQRRRHRRGSGYWPGDTQVRPKPQ